jgi:thioester reductase-like protein
MPCYIYRVGQLCGDSNTGAWNTTEMYPLTLVGGGSYMKKVSNIHIDIELDN